MPFASIHEHHCDEQSWDGRLFEYWSLQKALSVRIIVERKTFPELLQHLEIEIGKIRRTWLTVALSLGGQYELLKATSQPLQGCHGGHIVHRSPGHRLTSARLMTVL